MRGPDGDREQIRREGTIRDRNGSVKREPRRPRAADREVSLRDTGNFEEIGRVGRRSRFRPEVLVLVFGAVFLVAALVKPWSTQRGIAPQSSSDLAVAPTATVAPVTTPAVAPVVVSAVPTPSPTVDIWALVPPGDYRPGQWPPSVPHASANPGLQPVVAPSWPSVNWAFLTQPDPHATWGVAALTMPVGGSAAAQPVPSTDWVKETAPWDPSVPAVPAGSSVFAIALTWPSSIKVSNVTFDYSGGFVQTARPTPSAVPPAVGVAPIPAKGKPAASITSGSFWIAPSSDLVSPTPSALQAVWQASPWSWPAGMYRATLQTNAGTMIVVIDLQG
jgi:hypothetical protein